jgi:hypothetical protein
MLEEGNHREALAWVLPYHLATADVLLVDGPASEKPVFAERQAAFLRALGMDTEAVCASKVAQARRLGDRIFALADEVVASHPSVVD